MLLDTGLEYLGKLTKGHVVYVCLLLKGKVVLCLFELFCNSTDGRGGGATCLYVEQLVYTRVERLTVVRWGIVRKKHPVECFVRCCGMLVELGHDCAAGVHFVGVTEWSMMIVYVVPSAISSIGV